MIQMKLTQRSIHAIAQVLCRINQSAVKVKHQQLEPLNRDRPQNMNHASSLPGEATDKVPPVLEYRQS
jgi:hypothetical protein